MKSDTWDINELMAAFKEELEAREKSKFVGGNINVVEKSWLKSKKVHDPSTAAALHVTERVQTNCYFCNHQGHKSFNCILVTDPERRREILKRKGRCFVCLRTGHVANHCQSELKCNKCNGRHHGSLCRSGFHLPPAGNNVTQPSTSHVTQPSTSHVTQPSTSQPSSGATAVDQSQGTTSTLYVNAKTSVLLQTATATVSNPNSLKSLQARVIFDSGSQRSYISSRVRNALELPSLHLENLVIKTFGSDSHRPKSCDVVQFCVSKAGGGLNLYLNAYAVPSICSPLCHQRIEFAKTSYGHLSNLELADSSSGDAEMPIDILIGSDFYWNFMTGETRTGRNGGPVAIKTHLGWVLSGPVNKAKETLTDSSVFLNNTHVLRLNTEPVEENDCSLKKELSKFWNIEALGIAPESEDAVYQQFLKTVHMRNARYEVPLPWKEMHPALPDNFSLSYTRLNSLVRRLRKTPDVLREYDKVIKDQEQKGIVETVNSEAVAKVHYLPHREVVRSDKQTTKLRIVFDASAKREGPSLNDCVYAGPPLSPLLMDIMMRFRCFKVALVGDIEKAFLMVGVEERDRDALRFLWVKDPFADQPEVEVKRFTRLVFGLSSSPFLLNATLRHHMSKYAVSDPEFVKKFLEALYVDDLSTGDQTVEGTYQLFLKSKLRMLEAGFNMRKWSSNSKELIEKIKASDYSHEVTCSDELKLQEDDGTYTSATLGSHEVNEEREHKILGTTWNHDTDELSVDLTHIVKSSEDLPVTKRTVLKVTARVYDPLGWISPILIDMKLLFQKICQTKGDWDAELSPDIRECYDQWMTELQKVGNFRIPRCYFNVDDPEPISVQLHGFSDASSHAYAAVVYMRIEQQAEARSVLVASKTRVAPLTGETIPRLELLGAVILARLMKRVADALSEILKVDKFRCWVDSTAVLYWIIGEKKQWKQFVQNRIMEIRSLVPPSCWSYCPTDANPADLPSRGMKPSDLATSDKWWNGPTFLTLPEEQWPTKPDTALLEENVVREMKAVFKGEDHPTSTNLTSVSNVNLTECFALELFSSSKKLFRVTGYVLQFISRLKEKVKSAGVSQKSRGESLTVKEIEDAEVLWLQEVQKPLVSSDKFDQQRLSLGLFADDKGVYRCKGRLENAELPYQVKHPVLLPPRSHLTTLIIRECHRRVMHRGVKDTLTELRCRYWITKGRQVVKAELRKCTVCSRVQGRPFVAPATPDLPQFRVEKSFPFANTGVDFAGPLYVKNVFGGEGKSKMHKVYIALFTCASTRAVHLDLVPALDAQSFIRSLKRFFARRGVNQLFISDNAKTFKSKEVQQFIRNMGVAWKFNLPRSPWWGGFFERMVRCTKSSLKKILGVAKLTYEELLTVLTEVEGVLNSRPLTYVYSDEVEEPLTPSHLMIGRRLLSSVQNVELDENAPTGTANDVNRRAKYLKSLLSHFWNRWQKEYLTELRQFHQYAVNDKNKQKESIVKEGDVVIVKEENTPRSTWRLGRVKELMKGRDDKVRGALVTVAGKQKKLTELKRPIQHLIPVECKESGKGDDMNHAVTTSPVDRRTIGRPVGGGPSESTRNTRERPRRQAAIMSDFKRQQFY